MSRSRSTTNPYEMLPDTLVPPQQPTAPPRPRGKGVGAKDGALPPPRARDPNNPSTENDLSTTENLNNQKILAVLKARYERGTIHHHDMYMGIKRRSEKPPHIFYIADKAYQRMLNTEKTQCILVSGESGAGKTESTKHMIRHIVRRSKGNMGELHECIIKINPLLEAFGNAETVMNQNSSRFGKYVELIFSRDGDIMGATINEYLLEKSRVVYQGQGEKNYHIFYYMFAGMPQDKLKYYWLESPSEHRIMRGQDEKKDIFNSEENLEHCKKMFKEVELIFKTIGFTPDEVNMIYTCLAAILYITNVEFETDNNSAEDGLLIINDYPVQSVSDQLVINRETLFQALICVISTINGEEVVNFKTVDQACDGRDALAKAIYQRLFSWIVFRVNQTIQPKDPAQMMRALSLGILDLSGFENFPKNGFEQLCINIANEQLQFFFNRHILQEEQEEYEREGIDWRKIQFESNEELLELVIGNSGLLQTLDDQSRLSQTTDQGLVAKWRKEFANNPNYKAIQGDQPQFYIVHYAGQVKYHAEGFLEKNRDNVGSNLVNLLKSSKIDFIKDLFSMNLTDVGKIPSGSIIRPPRTNIRSATSTINRNNNNAHSMETLKRLSRNSRTRPGMPVNKVERTVSQFFKKSLQELLRKMKVADPLFVRCIKPNEFQQPKLFDDPLVQKQLLYNGVLQIAEIRKRGYPVRMEMTKFVEQFHLASSFNIKIPEATQDSCKRILTENKIPDKEYVLGKRKVFMKDEVPQFLREKCLREATQIFQRYYRGHCARKLYNKMKLEKAEAEARVMASTSSSISTLASVHPPPPPPPPPPAAGPPAPGGIPTQPKLPPIPAGGGTQTNPDPNRDSGASGSMAGTSEETVEDEDDEDEESLDDSDYSSSSEDEDDGHPSWDIAQLIPRDRISPSESFAGFLKALRALTYILVFLLVWVCATAGTGCVLLLTAALRRGEQDQAKDEESDYYHASRSQLLLVISFPHVLLFLVSFAKSLFGRIAWPPAGLFIWIIIQEVLFSFGLVLLVFYLLPNFGSIYGLGIMNSVFLIPAILKLFFSKRENKDCKRTCLSYLSVLCDILAVLIQFAAIGLPIVVGYFELGHDYHHASRNITGNVTEFNLTNKVYFHQRLPHPYWQWPLALFLVSLKWWENFVAKNCCCLNLFDVRKVLHATRAKMSLITSVINFVSTYGFVYLLEYVFGKQYKDKESYWMIVNPILEDDFVVAQLTPVIVVIVCGLVCYYCCSLASKLLMQEIAYTLPIYLATPTVAAVIILQCIPPHYIPLMPATGDVRFEFLCDQSTKDRGWYIAGAAIWWVSALWLCNHLWFPRNVKLAMSEKLFITPFYVGPLIIPSMMMNRRRNDNEVIKVGVDQFRLSDETSKSRSSDNDKKKAETTYEDVYTASKKRADGVIPIVYSCATMWHETKNEMIQLLKSVFRMDLDQGIRRFAQDRFQVKDPNYYEYETHVFFDDAMELNEEGTEWTANQFVRDLSNCIDEAASSVWNREKKMMPPLRVVTPYGGRLFWRLPAGTNLVVHLKDKNKIRHKKRWSQVMYMYYLLGYRMFGDDSQMGEDRMREDRLASMTGSESTQNKDKGKKMSWLESALARAKGDGHVGKSQIFRTMEELLIQQSENTFLLALDGDVDFKPDAVRLLVDRMRKNEKTGAACGRIHPIGSGPLVWYQIFEYAVGHWFQKATEHVLGCVLCSPGCFSLFRGSALMDDNVMKKYTTKSTEARHFLQYDQGEDRWLCTLLLQQGYRVDYTAAADALTYAPEGFDEFFNQRRRWVPSTLANIMDLLSDYQNTILINDNVSYPFVFYQFFLMMSTILGPATIVLAIATAFQTVMSIKLYQGYLLSVAPVAVYLVICFTCKTKTQLAVAGFLSTLYAVVMTVVLVGIIKNIATQSILDPSLLFLFVTSVCFIFAGLIHPYEISCLAHGVMYFLCIPAGYLVLMIYSLSNLHIVSWGTREVARRKTKEELAAEKAAEEEKKQLKKKKGWLSFFRGEAFMNELKEMLSKIVTATRESPVENEMLKTLQKIHKDMKKLNQRLSGKEPDDSSSSESEQESSTDQPTSSTQETLKKTSLPTAPKKKDEPQIPEDDADNPAWVKDDRLGHGEVARLDASEQLFWQTFIKKYLQPLKKNPKKEKEVAQALLDLRTNANFGFWLINGLWVVFNYMVSKDATLNQTKIAGYETQPLGFIFLVFFLTVLLLQMIGMVIHRWGTFLQLIALTELSSPFKRKIDPELGELTAAEAIKLTTEVITEDPVPDYDEEDPLSGTAGDNVEQLVRRRTTKKIASGLRGDQLRETIMKATIGRNAGRHLPEIPSDENTESRTRRSGQVTLEMGPVAPLDAPEYLPVPRDPRHNEIDRLHDPRRGRAHPISYSIRNRFRSSISSRIGDGEYLIPNQQGYPNTRTRSDGPRPRSSDVRETRKTDGRSRRPHSDVNQMRARALQRGANARRGGDAGRGRGPERVGNVGRGGDGRIGDVGRVGDAGQFERRRRQRFSRKHYFHDDEFDRMFNKNLHRMAGPGLRAQQRNGHSNERL